AKIDTMLFNIRLTCYTSWHQPLQKRVQKQKREHCQYCVNYAAFGLGYLLRIVFRGSILYAADNYRYGSNDTNNDCQKSNKRIEVSFYDASITAALKGRVT